MVAEPVDFRARRQLTMVSGTKEKATRIYQSTNFLQVDMDVLELVKGDWKAACLLAIIIDMQQQSKDGWVYHSWPQWESHHFSRAEVERCADPLKPLGLKIEVRDHDGRLTRHYKVDIKKLKDSVATLQKSRRVKNEADTGVEDIHPAKKSQGETKSHGVEKLQEPCEKVTGDPVEKSQGLYERSDLINRSTETDQLADANASGGAAVADAPNISHPASQRKSVKAKATPLQENTRASPQSETDPALNAYRAACWKLLREKYGQDVAKEGRELRAMKAMFDKKIPIEDVQGCWNATLLDPRWDTDPLTMAIIEEKMQIYRRGPDGYLKGMQSKRKAQVAREERNTHDSRQRNTTAPTRQGQFNSERSRAAKAEYERLMAEAERPGSPT